MLDNRQVQLYLHMTSVAHNQFFENTAYCFPIELLLMLQVGQSCLVEAPALPVRLGWILALICYLSFPIWKESLTWCKLERLVPS